MKHNLVMGQTDVCQEEAQQKIVILLCALWAALMRSGFILYQERIKGRSVQLVYIERRRHCGHN